MKVFLSSTFTDLQDHRRLAATAVERLGHQPIRMETFGARSAAAPTVCTDEILGSDIFIGIYAHRYGHVPPGASKSITEQEFDLALDRGMPVLCFFVEDSHHWLPASIESGNAQDKLRALKDRVRSLAVTDDFTWPEDLAFKIAASLGRHLLSTAPAITITTPISQPTSAPPIAGDEPVPTKRAAPRGLAIEILSLNQVVAADRSISANMRGVAGRLDVIVRAQAGAEPLSSVRVSIAVGSDRVEQEQTLSASSPNSAQGIVPIILTFGFNTHAFNATTGVPALHNGDAIVEATATTTAESLSTTAKCRLANADGAAVFPVFAAFTDANGLVILTKTTDPNGYDWRHGAVTIMALPVIYSGRHLSSLSITLPGANIPTQTLTAPPYFAVWSGSNAAPKLPNVAGRILVDPSHFEADGTTPKGVTPSIVGLDQQGRDLGLVTLNAGFAGVTFRLDNATPWKHAPKFLHFR